MTVVDIGMPAQCVASTPECAANCLLSAFLLKPGFCPELTNTTLPTVNILSDIEMCSNLNHYASN